MIVSRWDEQAGLYHYYEMPQGKIRIRLDQQARWVCWHDIELHAEGVATPDGTGEIPKGVIVNSVQAQEVEAGDGFDAGDLIFSLAGASLLGLIG